MADAGAIRAIGQKQPAGFLQRLILVSSDIRNWPPGDTKNWPPVDVAVTRDRREGLSR
jgi:hypothetical protein